MHHPRKHPQATLDIRRICMTKIQAYCIRMMLVLVLVLEEERRP
jgi:hypothetical protein